MIVTRGLGRPAEGNLAVAGLGLRTKVVVRPNGPGIRLRPISIVEQGTSDDDAIALAITLLLA